MNDFQQHFGSHLQLLLQDLDEPPVTVPVVSPAAPPSPPPPEPEPLTYSDDPITALAFLTGCRWGRQCSYDGYIYTHDRTHPTGVSTWQCRDRKQHTPFCKGRLTTLDTDVTASKPHCHTPSVTDCQKSAFLSQVKRNNTNETPADVIRSSLAGVSDDVMTMLPTMNNMKQQIYRHRIKARGHPTTRNTSAASTTITPSCTIDHQQNRFLLRDLFTVRGRRVIIYINEKFLRKLNSAEIATIFLDGTFKIAPKHFLQVWILRGFINAICFPFAYCLLEDKHHTTYEKCLSEISAAAPNFNPVTAYLDFEQAEHNSIYGLGFLPREDVLTTWTDLKQMLILLYPTKTPALITYFEATWLDTKYPIAMWNVHNVTLMGDPRTNNYSEGGNNAMNQSAGVTNPTISRFVDKLKEFNAEAMLNLLQLESGQPPTRKPRSKEVERQQRIKDTVQRYDFANRLGFCRTLGHLYS